MPKTIGWRLTLSFAAIALVAAVVLGAVLLVILQNYYTQRELGYLNGNARAISAVLTETLKDEAADPQVQSQIAGFAFLSQTRVRVLNALRQVVYDSGTPSEVQLGLGLARPETIPGEIAPRDFLKIITFEKTIENNTEQTESKIELKLPGGDGNVFLFRSGSAVGSPFGFDLGAETGDGDARSNEVVRQTFTTATDPPLTYTVELSDGPALGRDILTSVAIGWGIASAIAIAIAAVVGWFISRRISAPVLALTNVTTRMAHGDLTIRADTSPRDEFGQLADSFNDMADRVETTIVMLRRFVSDAAHELGTPLTALKGNLELAADENDIAQRALFLSRAQRTVARLETVSRDLLDLSRLEAPASQAVATNVNLLALVQTSAEVYASRAEQAGLQFETALPFTPVFIHGDGAQIQRAMGNLIDNAIKFTPAGGTVRLELQDDGASTRIQVSDTGIGIPPEDLPQLFQRFHRARNAAAYPGSGLGLAIVQAIMQAQHGLVRVEPLAVGTRFTLEWPHD